MKANPLRPAEKQKPKKKQKQKQNVSNILEIILKKQFTNTRKNQNR